MSGLDIEGVLAEALREMGRGPDPSYYPGGADALARDRAERLAAVLREQIAAWLGGIADSDRKEGTRTGSMGLLIIADACDALAALVAPSRVTHCANCGAEVPVDQPHQVGECVAPSRVPGEET